MPKLSLLPVAALSDVTPDDLVPFVNETGPETMIATMDVFRQALFAAQSGSYTAAALNAISTLTLTGAAIVGAPTWESNQAITLSTAAQPNVTSLGTLAANLLFVDATYDIGASGATRPRNVYLSGSVLSGGWEGSVVGPAYGGTGEANNAANTITFSGSYGLTLTLTNTTSVTLPTSGTLVNSAVTALSSLVTVGALVSGSIASGFGNINNASNSLTTGALVATTGTFTGNVTPSADNTYALGTASKRWSDFQTMTATFSGAVSMGALTATTGEFSSASAQQIISMLGATTGPQYLIQQNTGAQLLLGIDNSAGSGLITGSGLAYASVFATQNATALAFATNSALRFSIGATGVAVFTGSVTGGAASFTTGAFSSLGAFASGDKYVIADASGNLHLSALGPLS